MCKIIWFNYFIFVDYLMIFSKGYVFFVGMVMEVFGYFYKVFGFKVNDDKLYIFFGGVNV